MDASPAAEAERLELGARQLQQRALALRALRRTLSQHFQGPAAERQQRRLERHQRELHEVSDELRLLARRLRAWASLQPPLPDATPRDDADGEP